MKRHQLAYIKKWMNRATRKPLNIRGARQAGKTTLVRLACEEMGVELIELNMEDPQDFSTLLSQNDPHKVSQAILFGQKIYNLDSEKQLFFPDEAQACPELIPFLRYCYERAPEYRVTLRGSLLESVIQADNYSFPVGRVEFLYLGPMAFEEF